MKNRVSLSLITFLLMLAVPVETLHAATYTQPEKQRISVIRKRYQKLSHKSYDDSDMYQLKPRFNTKLQRGQLSPHYQNQLLAYVNFYRDLSGQRPVRYGFKTNQQAQMAAATMASAGGFSHGLKGLKQPHTVSAQQWQVGQQVTATSNIGEVAPPEKISATIGNYFRDDHNVEGNNTGHRAWLLSPVIQSIGIGVAGKPKSEFAYSDIYFADQANRPITPNRAEVINYPAASVFPRELIVGKDAKHPIYWSSNFTLAQATEDQVKVSITDKTAHKESSAKDVHVNKQDRFGQFGTIVTYKPTSEVQNGHQYEVRITGLKKYPKGYHYQFKPFELDPK